jgi:hypothetical protein
MIEKYLKENMTEMSDSFKKWLGYFATGFIALIIFGVVGWIALITTGYVYLEHLRNTAGH